MRPAGKILLRCGIAVALVVGLLGQVAPAAAQAPGAAPPPPPSSSPPPAANPDPNAGSPSTAPPPEGATGPGAAPGAAPATGGPPTGAAPPPPLGIRRAKETQLQIAVGGEFFVPLTSNRVVGNGPAFLLSAHWLKWFGPFMIGGGTSIHYSFMIENQEPKDKIQQITLNGDFMIGGGVYQKFAVYGHVLLGAGVASIYDGETDLKLLLPWLRAVAGIGAWMHVSKLLSLGVLVDVGWPGTVEVLGTLSFHFAKRP